MNYAGTHGPFGRTRRWPRCVQSKHQAGARGVVEPGPLASPPQPRTALSKAAAAADSVMSREPPGEEAGCPEPRFHGQEFGPGLAPPWCSEKTCTERLVGGRDDDDDNGAPAASQLKPAAHPDLSSLPSEKHQPLRAPHLG